MTKQRRADLLLILVTAFWGASYFLSDLCLTELPPLNLSALRFTMAFVLLGSVFWKNVAHISRATLKYSILVGIALTGTYVFYGYGLPLTSLTNAAFVCALPVVTTPLFDFLFFHNRPSKRFTGALVVCTVGLAMLTLGDNFRPAIGDIICMGVPVCYAFDLLITDRAVRDPEVDPLCLGVCQLGVVAVITGVMSLILEQPRLPASTTVWGAAILLGIFCTGIAFVVQTTQQKFTSASHVGLIFTLEPLFAAIVNFLFANERLSTRGYLGAALMMLSLVMMEIDLPQLLKKKK